MVKKLTPMSEDFNQWYTEIVQSADLADYSPVKGTMVIKPYGYALWENIQAYLDKRFKETGHQNAYFPMFIPKSFIEKEAEHVEGFSPELATVTHAGGKELEEPLIVRPTSETIINHMFSKWISSHRDLPMLINQWSNVVRWEMRTRLFLRTSEFLWQEGHTAHATEDEAREESLKMLDIYEEFARDIAAVSVVKGTKSEMEKFAGATTTYSIEAMMNDLKALQAGTSHFLGQNFAKAFDVKYADREGKLNHVWATSWGVSSRLMGALIMTHSDDKGLVLPPKLSPFQVVIVPIYKNENQFSIISKEVDRLKLKLSKNGISVKFDSRDSIRPGAKFAQHEIQGVPVRITIGPKDIENKTVEIFRRDNLTKENIEFDNITNYILNLLTEIQNNLFDKALNFRNSNITEVENFEEFKDVLKNKGGFISAQWDGTDETENKIKELTKATIRCIPLTQKKSGKCIFSGEPSNGRVLFAKAY